MKIDYKELTKYLLSNDWSSLRSIFRINIIIKAETIPIVLHNSHIKVDNEMNLIMIKFDISNGTKSDIKNIGYDCREYKIPDICNCYLNLYYNPDNPNYIINADDEENKLCYPLNTFKDKDYILFIINLNDNACVKVL